MSATTSTHRTSRSTSSEGKKRYHKPKLVDYGGIRALTASMGLFGASDGGFFAPKTSATA